MSPKTQEKWIATGLEILGTEGVSAITIDRMTEVLGVTKGSFYHHFKNIQHFKVKLLEAWEADSTAIIHAIERSDTPVKVLLGLLGEFEKRSPLPEIAIRAWAVSNPVAREHMERLDALRIAFLTEVFSRLRSGPRAETAARTFYCIIIGSLAVHPPFSMEVLSALFHEFFRLHRMKHPGKSIPVSKGEQP